MAANARDGGGGVAEGDVVRAFNALPELFRSRRDAAARLSAASSADDASFAADAVAALSPWLAYLVAFGGGGLAPTLARHWIDAIDATLSIATGGGGGVFGGAVAATNSAMSVDRFPYSARAAARAALAGVGRDALSPAHCERLARWFPRDAPGNFGVGALEGLPSRSLARGCGGGGGGGDAPPPARRFYLSDAAEMAEEAALAAANHRARPSLRDRLRDAGGGGARAMPPPRLAAGSSPTRWTIGTDAAAASTRTLWTRRTTTAATATADGRATRPRRNATTTSSI